MTKLRRPDDKDLTGNIYDLPDNKTSILESCSNITQVCRPESLIFKYGFYFYVVTDQFSFNVVNYACKFSLNYQ